MRFWIREPFEYDDPNKRTANQAIFWATRWLYDKAQQGYKQYDSNANPQFQFGGWNSWGKTTENYKGTGPSGKSYEKIVYQIFKNGYFEDLKLNKDTNLWPQMTNSKARQ